MNTKTTGRTLRRLYIGLAVSAILSMIFVFYYYYVSNKEQKIQERNFRVLHRIEENFERRIRDSRQLIIGKLKMCGACTDQQNKFRLDTLRQVLKNDELFTYEEDTLGFSGDWEIISKGKKSRIYFYISSKELKETVNPVFYIKISADIDKILAGVLRYDAFSSYILTGKSGIAYNNCKEICQVPVTDSLLKNDNVTKLQIGSGNFYIFSHPFFKGIDQGILLCGIVSAEQYAHEKHSVPGSFLLTIFLLLLVILLAFPFIKSYLVSVEDMLEAGDILLALLSLFILCYMYVFMHMNIYTVSRDEKIKREMLQITSDSIKSSFLTEVKNMHQQLTYYDTMFSKAHNPTGENETGIKDSVRFRPEFYPDFSRVEWLSRQGLQIGELEKGMTGFSKPTTNSESDYHDRDYFKAVINKALWYPDSADADKIYLEPVYSRIDGSFRAIMSKESNYPLTVAILSSEMRSVINTVQPGEIDFCLLDDKGAILFTSAGNEFLNENLVEECDQSTELNSAINARAKTFFDASFMGKDYTFYASPVEGLPLHLVTFSYNGMSGQTQLQLCIFTSLFILAILILFSCVIFFLVFLTEEKNKDKIVKRSVLDLSMLYPSSNYLYRDFGGIFFNSLLMAGLLICGYICRNEPLTLIILLLINASGTTAAFCYARVDLKPGKRIYFWVITSISFILCDIFILCLGAKEHPSPLICLICYELFLLWVIYQLRTIRYYEKDFPVFANTNIDKTYTNILTKKRSILQTFIIKMQEKFNKRFKTFYHQYALMLVTWFLLIALLPTVFVYRYFYKNEIENRIESMQIDIAKKWFDKGVYTKEGNYNPVKPVSEIKSYLSGYYQTKLLPDSSYENNQGLQETKLNSFLNHFRFSMKSKNDHVNTIFPVKSDTTIRFYKDSGKLSLSYQNLLNHSASRGKNTIVIQSRLPDFPMPPPRSLLPFVLYFIAPLIFLILLYFVITFFLKRFFLFEILPAKKHDDTLFFKGMAYNYNTKPIKLIIVGVTSSGKKDLIKQALAFIYNEENKDKAETHEKEKERALFIDSHFFTYDMTEANQAILNFEGRTHKKGEVILFSHFEHNLADKETNDKKFRLISQIFQMSESDTPHLVILTNIHPSVFLNNLKAKTEINSFNAEDYINKQDYYNWTGLLSKFEIYTKAYRDKVERDRERESNILTAYDAYKSKYTFYLSIWNSSDRIEKFVLYDLAKDNLVNYRNKEALYSLYCKGLVIQDDTPRIMNEEFRTFILTESDEWEMKLAKRQSGRGSAWNTFRIPFLIILFGVLLFVFFTQQETFNKLMAILVALTGSIPILIKLLPFTQEKKPG